MKNKIILLALLSLTSIAQAEENTVIDQAITISTVIPQTCNFRSGKNFAYYEINGIYHNSALTYNSSFQFDCVTGATLKVTVGMGSNPKSTADARRLPLLGESGDVEHYFLYTLSMGGVLLDDVTGYSKQFTSGWSTERNLTLMFSSPKEQPYLKTGKYSENLPIYFDYY